MPCYNGDENTNWVERNTSDRLRDQIEKLEAVLCGVMRVDPTIVNKIDWSEVGITKRQHMAWWRVHKEEDERRIQREQEQRLEREAQLRKELKKLEAQKKKVAKKKVARK